MEFEDPGYSDEVMVKFNKIYGEIDEQKKQMEQFLTMVFGKRWSKHLTELESFLETKKPQVCIPKSGNILLIHIERHRYLICIGRLVISSISGIWWKR